MNINELVYKIASEKGISLANIARSINTSPQNLNNKLKRGSLSLDEFEKICNALHLDINLSISDNNRLYSVTNNVFSHDEELEFAIFCIEKLKDELKIDGKQAYSLFVTNTDLLYSYLVKNYDVLHTQSEEYIVNDIKEFLLEKGISI